MQFQVPQFIETEDKVVGPLSLRQFIYVGIAGGISALLYFLVNTWVWIIFSVILVGSALAIAFIKVQGRPLFKVILAAFNFYWKPQMYVWQPEHPQLPKSKAVKATPVVKPSSGIVEKIATGMALHKSWQKVSTGEKISDKQFAEQKMNGRYQIFQKMTGERDAARRVDYR